jgi:hypothetical protein
VRAAPNQEFADFKAASVIHHDMASRAAGVMSRLERGSAAG